MSENSMGIAYLHSMVCHIDKPILYHTTYIDFSYLHNLRNYSDKPILY